MKKDEKTIYVTEATSGNLYLVTDKGRVFIRPIGVSGQKTWYKLDLPNEDVRKEG